MGWLVGGRIGQIAKFDETTKTEPKCDVEASKPSKKQGWRQRPLVCIMHACCMSNEPKSALHAELGRNLL